MVLEGAKRWWLTPSYGGLPKEYFSAVVCDDGRRLQGGSALVRACCGRTRGDIADKPPRNTLIPSTTIQSTGMRSNKFGARCYGHLGSLSSGARAVDDGIALAETSFAASRPSINGEQPKSGIPSRRKVRSSSMPRESANVNPCRLRHTRLDALAVATICRVSPTHAPINFPSRPIDTSVICTGCVMSSNLCTSAYL